MSTFSARLRRLSKQTGAKPIADTEGVIAVLQVARRLVKDAGMEPVEALREAADNFASPKDPVRAFWAAYFAWSNGSGDTPLDVFDDAIRSQGLVNQAVRKGPR